VAGVAALAASINRTRGGSYQRRGSAHGSESVAAYRKKRQQSKKQWRESGSIGGDHRREIIVTAAA